MSAFTGKVAAVTGAGGGIGRELAVGLGKRGARLAISDVNQEGLAGTAKLLEAAGADCFAEPLDVSDRAAVEAHAESVAGHYGVVHQIYNNAGIAGQGGVLDGDYDYYERVLSINLWGVINGTKAFMPHLVASGAGHVCNISSLNGYAAQAELSAYCTSKFAVRGFTESLRQEMLKTGTPVGVTCVHPGGVKTDIATAAMQSAEERGEEITEVERKRLKTYNEKLLKMPADEAARIILDGVEKGKPRVRVGNDAVAVDLIVRALPTIYPKLMMTLERLTLGR